MKKNIVMDTQINYPIAMLMIIAAIIFIVLLIRRNRKDEKNFERDVKNSELKPKDRNPHGHGI